MKACKRFFQQNQAVFYNLKKYTYTLVIGDCRKNYILYTILLNVLFANLTGISRRSLQLSFLPHFGSTYIQRGIAYLYPERFTKRSTKLQRIPLARIAQSSSLNFSKTSNTTNQLAKYSGIRCFLVKFLHQRVTCYRERSINFLTSP